MHPPEHPAAAPTAPPLAHSTPRSMRARPRARAFAVLASTAAPAITRAATGRGRRGKTQSPRPHAAGPHTRWSRCCARPRGAAAGPRLAAAAAGSGRRRSVSNRAGGCAPLPSASGVGGRCRCCASPQQSARVVGQAAESCRRHRRRRRVVTVEDFAHRLVQVLVAVHVR